MGTSRDSSHDAEVEQSVRSATCRRTSSGLRSGVRLATQARSTTIREGSTVRVKSQRRPI